MERKGVEPSTSALRMCEHTVLTENPSELAPTPSVRCTNGCTSEAENANGGLQSTVTPTEPPKPSEAGFAAALAMIAALPLSDAEKADAVRRLMQANG